MKEIVRYKNCFVCGDENQTGLQAKFYYDGKQAVSELIAMEQFEGYRGIYHGGVISTLLDEVMIKAILAEGIYAVTAEMTIRFIKPVPTGAKIQFRGWIIKNRGRIYKTGGEVVDQDNQPFATASGKYVKAANDLKDKLLQSIE